MWHEVKPRSREVLEGCNYCNTVRQIYYYSVLFLDYDNVFNDAVIISLSDRLSLIKVAHKRRTTNVRNLMKINATDDLSFKRTMSRI